MKRVGGHGFTIVELLIVVVVIAVLASVTVVAYSGIQNQAHDAVIKSDLATIKKRFDMYYQEHGVIPTSNQQLAEALASFRAASQSYATSPTTNHNLIHCWGSQQGTYAIVSLSKSGDAYFVTAHSGIQPLTTTWSSQSPICTHALPGNYVEGNNWRGYAGDDASTGPWRAWTGVRNP